MPAMFRQEKGYLQQLTAQHRPHGGKYHHQSAEQQSPTTLSCIAGVNDIALLRTANLHNAFFHHLMNA
jgi:hypothetical protein